MVVPDDHDDEPDEESVFSEQSFGAELAGGSTVPPISDPLRKKPKTNVVKKNMSEVLSQFLAESRRELQESRASIAEVIGYKKYVYTFWFKLIPLLVYCILVNPLYFDRVCAEYVDKSNRPNKKAIRTKKIHVCNMPC